MNSILSELRSFFNEYLEYRKNRISLISSENLSSRLLLASYSLGLSDQYCSRLPEDRYRIGNLTFGNVAPLDRLNEMSRNIVKEVFSAAECEIRLLSGLNGLTVILMSLLSSGKTLFRVADEHGGHLSTAPLSDRLGLSYRNLYLGKDMRIDVDRFREEYRRKKPDLIFLDSSYVLFPYPLEEIREIVGDGVPIVYDASHFISLVAAGMFQNPFSEGADIIHSTTHKTFWGPQKSMLLFRTKGSLDELIKDKVKDYVSNTHMHHVLALYIAALEFKQFGESYAIHLQRNAKLLGETLHRHGFHVVAEEYGFTRSNQIWIDMGPEKKAAQALRKLELVGVSSNMIFLPENRWGLRLGVNEITRRNVDDEGITRLARICFNSVYEKMSIERIKGEVKEFQAHYSDVAYSFDNMKEGRELIEMLSEHLNSFQYSASTNSSTETMVGV